MGRLLDALCADAETGTLAISANLRISGPPDAQDSQIRKIRSGGESAIASPASAGFAGSQDSQTELRAHLLALAADEGLPAELVHGLDDADVAACAGLPDDLLRGYLHALVASEQMDRGQVPPDWGAPAARTCEGCGLVLLWPDCPPVVKACPWCFRRKAGKTVPRPPVTCGTCRHYLPEPVNPAAGMGGCALGTGRADWPMKPHRCADWRGGHD